MAGCEETQWFNKESKFKISTAFSARAGERSLLHCITTWASSITAALIASCSTCFFTLSFWTAGYHVTWFVFLYWILSNHRQAAATSRTADRLWGFCSKQWIQWDNCDNQGGHGTTCCCKRSPSMSGPWPHCGSLPHHPRWRATNS